MSAVGETEKAAVEQQQPTVDVTAPEKQQQAEKPTREKRPRAPKENQPKAAKTASHPPYFQMIKEALLALNEKGGSSPHAIAKYMEEKHKAVLPANYRKMLGLQLKNSATRGKLIKIKASYKLSEAGKKDMAAQAAAKKPEKVRPTDTAARRTRKSEATVKKPAAKKAKKAAPAKPKQPKSIKSSAAKKAKKAAV